MTDDGAKVRLYRDTARRERSRALRHSAGRCDTALRGAQVGPQLAPADTRGALTDARGTQVGAEVRAGRSRCLRHDPGLAAMSAAWACLCAGWAC